MSKEVMHREASDNEYLHRDFHGALSAAIEYLDQQYGESEVKGFLRTFTRSYYGPLIDKVNREGLMVLEEHFRQIYEREHGNVNIRCADDELLIDVHACPAVMHMRNQGYSVARLFGETIRSVGMALCEGTAFEFELLDYDIETGRSRQRFFRRGR